MSKFGENTEIQKKNYSFNGNKFLKWGFYWILLMSFNQFFYKKFQPNYIK